NGQLLLSSDGKTFFYLDGNFYVAKMPAAPAAAQTLPSLVINVTDAKTGSGVINGVVSTQISVTKNPDGSYKVMNGTTDITSQVTNLSDVVNAFFPPAITTPAAPATTVPPVTLTLQNINSITYDGSQEMNNQLIALQPSILASLPNYVSVTPGSPLAYMLGLGDGSGLNSGQAVKSSDQKTSYIYSTDKNGS